MRTKTRRSRVLEERYEQEWRRQEAEFHERLPRCESFDDAWDLVLCGRTGHHSSLGYFLRWGVMPDGANFMLRASLDQLYARLAAKGDWRPFREGRPPGGREF